MRCSTACSVPSRVQRPLACGTCTGHRRTCCCWVLACTIIHRPHKRTITATTGNSKQPGRRESKPCWVAQRARACPQASGERGHERSATSLPSARTPQPEPHAYNTSHCATHCLGTKPTRIAAGLLLPHGYIYMAQLQPTLTHAMRTFTLAKRTRHRRRTRTTRPHLHVEHRHCATKLHSSPSALCKRIFVA